MFLLGILLAQYFLVHGLPMVEIMKPEPEPKQMQLIEDYPELDSGNFEGDMIVQTGRGIPIYGQYYRWPENTVPYDMTAIKNEVHRNIILKAMQTLMYAVGEEVPDSANKRLACVHFRPRNESDSDFVMIQYGRGCSATVGFRQGRRMALNLNPNRCFRSGTIQHELLHILGFWHEQSHPDRDKYLTVHYENIQEGHLHNFNKYKWGITAYDMNYPYDYSSIMHYGSKSFSGNGQPTLVPNNSTAIIGLRQKLSDQDIAEVRRLYKCDT